jgi:pimeloyl-ACP methyl ester carboxylesterase
MSLYVEETGTREAPNIVFLHGIGASGWMWWNQTAALADFHCLNVDLPGHGKSNQVNWVSLADTADQVADVIRSRATNAKAHVVGLSLGGHVAMLLLERHAEVVDHAVISGVTIAPMPGRSMVNLQSGMMSMLFRQEWFVKRQAKSLGLPPAQQAAFTENALAMSGQAYRRIWEEVAHSEVSSTLSRVTNPTLVVAGGKEPGIILDAVRTFPKLMPNAQGRVAPGVGHGWNVEAPDLFNTMLRAWITDQRLPDRLRTVTS